MFLFILITIFALANLVQSGLVYPDTSRPIEPFRNNVPAPSLTVDSDYTFNFRVQTPSSSYPVIRVKFPTLYTSLTSGTTLTCVFTQSSTSITETCTIEPSNVIRFPTDPQGITSFQQITGGSASLTIKGLTNPAVAGGTGTGMFAMSTYSQANVIIDNNDAFGSIGLAPYYTNFAAAGISNDGAPIAGYVTNYILTFTNLVSLPAGSWFRLKFPTGYGFGATKCSFLSPSIDITCTGKNGYLYLTDLSQSLGTGSKRIRLRNIQNPYLKGTLTGFLFESMKEGINTVIEQSLSINSITITAGAINSPSITATPLNRNLRVDYTISFTPSNTIPAGGSIQITFPSTYNSLDATCRVIRGLTASASGLSCTADSTTKTVVISGFTETPPQYIQIKIYATNPNDIGFTPQFQIASFTSAIPSATTLIDENEKAGQVSIADVDNPFLVEIDVYTAYTNTSLDNAGPLDFRLYPKTALPASPWPISAATGYGRVKLQIPLWWWGAPVNNNVLRCSFGPLDSGNTNGYCYDNIRQIDMYTPNSKIFTQCDLPISIDYVRVTKIPGRWDFRVHTFINSTAEPVEQDLWTMDIPADPLGQASGISTSLDTGDNDAVLRVSFRTIVVVPIEGAINLNMSTVQNVYENTAAWDPLLGFNFGTKVFTSISCRIEIATNVVGYATAPNHRKANCVAFKGNSTHPAIIQIRGFSQQLGFNTLVNIDIPNVKICSDTTMNCVFELTTSYTTALENPYTLNYYTVNLGTIIGPNSPILGTTTVAPTFFPTMVCMPATYTYVIPLSQTLTQADNDHILLKFPANKFTFFRDGITSDAGSVVVIYVFETDEIYFLIRITGTLAAGSRTINLYGIRNSNGEINTAPRVDDFSGVITNAIYWKAGKEIEHITFDVTLDWSDGGIYTVFRTTYPNLINNPTSTNRNLNYDDEIPFSITFSVCHAVPAEGGIKVDIPAADFQYLSPTCQARSGVQGQTYNNGFTTNLKCELSGSSYLLTGFQDIDQFATISIGYTVKSLTTSVSTINYNITTFYDDAFTLNNDWLPADRVPAATDILGPNRFPVKFEFIDWMGAQKIARINTRGAFNLMVSMSSGLSAWTSSNDAHILFTFASSMQLMRIGAEWGIDCTNGLRYDVNPGPGMGLATNSQLDCRHDGLVSYYCEEFQSPVPNPDPTLDVPLVIKMRTNQFTGITANTRIPLVITSLGGCQSSNTNEGIYFTKAGRFTLTAEAYENGVATESSQFEFEVFGRDFLKYHVYSINKGRGGLTLIQVHITLDSTFPSIIPSSEDPLIKGKIVLEFQRTVSSGWASDLGTGILDKGQIPCNSVGLPILPAYADIQCILLHGLFNNPTRIEISGFDYTDDTNNPVFQIDIPNIYNPYDASNTFDIPNVVTRIYAVTVATGDEEERFYHGYDLINVTYPQNPATSPTTISVAPTLSETLVTTPLSTLTIWIQPTLADLVAPDEVIIELPLFWKASRVVTCTIPGATVACVGYPDSNWIKAKIDGGSIPISGASATFEITNPPALLPSTARIKAYYYHIFKLWNEATYPALGTTLVPFDILDAVVTSPTSDYGIESPFILEFTVPAPIPQGGAIRVVIPSQYTLSDLSCENNAIDGSAIQDKGFQCSIDPATRELIAYGFPALATDSLVVLNFRLTNPSTLVTVDDFLVETHYIYQASPTLETQIAVGPAVAPPIVAPSSTIEDWDVQYHEQIYLYSGDIGPIRFKINFPADFTQTDILIIEFPDEFSLAPNGQPHCLWDAVYSVSCRWTPGTPQKLTIYSPSGQDLPQAVDRILELTTLNARNGINGYVLPDPDTYTFNFMTSTDNGATFREQQYIDLPVYARKFTVFYSTTEAINYAMTTSIKIQFQPETSIPSNGKLILYVPTRTPEGVFLFNDDLRSGVANGGDLPCHDVGNTMGVEPTCKLKYGNRELGLPAEITVTGWTGTLGTGTLYSFRINGVKTPTESGDDKHVIMRLESYDGTSTVINAGLHYDFTIQKFDPTLVTAPSAPTTSPLNAGQSGVTFTLDLYSSQVLQYQALFDYLIIEFPPLIPQPLGIKCIDVTNNDCVSLPGNNWVIYDKSDADFPATTYTSVMLLNAKQTLGILPPASSVLTVYAVKNRVVVTKVTYPSIVYTSLAVQPIAVTITVPSVITIPYSAPLRFLISFTVPNGAIPITVPSTGAITFTLPASMTAIDSYCSNDVSSQMTGDYSCSYDTSTRVFTVTGFDQIAAGSTVAFTFWASINTASTDTAFDVALYQDAAKSMKIAEKTGQSGPTSSAFKGFQKLYPVDTEALNKYAARTNDIAPFGFFLSLDTAATQITVQFPTGVTLPSGASLVCGWGAYEAKTCTASATSPLVVTIETPHDPASLTLGTVYRMFISSYGGASKGLQYGFTGKGSVTVTAGTSVMYLPIEIFNTDFSSIILSPFWSNSGDDNYMVATIIPSQTILQGGKIVVRFPQYSPNGVKLFAADLGTGLTSGSSYFCTSESKSTFIPVLDEITCKIVYVTDVYTNVEVSGFQDISAGSSIDLFLGPFKNPNVPDSGHIDLIVHSEDPSGNILDQRYIRDVFTPQTLTKSTNTATYTRSDQTVQTPSVDYTWTALTPPGTLTQFSSIILQFPSTFTLTSAVSATVTAGTPAFVNTKTYANFVVIKPSPSSSFPSGNINIGLSGVTNPIAQEGTASTTTVIVSFVNYRSVETVYTTTATAFTAGTITSSSLSPNSFLSNLEVDLAISLTVGKNIPAGGVIHLTFPSFQSLSAYGGVLKVTSSASGAFATYTVLSSTTAMFTLGRSYVTTQGAITLKVTGLSPATVVTGQSLAIKVYADSTLTKLIASGTQTYSTISVRPAGTVQSFTPKYNVPSTSATIEIQYVLNSASSGANEIQINQNNWSGGANCYINGVASTYCGYDSGVLVMEAASLNAYPTVNTISFTATMPASTGNNRLYITSATVARSGSSGSSITSATSSTYLDSGSIVPAFKTNSFSSISIQTAHTTVSQPNIIKITAQLGSTAVSSPIFFVDLPDFPSGLGLDSSLGTSVPCTSSSAAITLTCTLEDSNLSFQSRRVRVSGYSALAASASVTFSLFRIMSPSSDMTTSIYVKLADYEYGNFENNVYESDTSFTFATGSPTTSAGAMGLGDTSVRNTQSYSLDISSTSLSSGDMIFYQLPYFTASNLPYTATCSVSCTLYSKAGVLQIPITSSATYSTITATSLANPPGVPTSTSDVVGYVVQGGAVVEIITYTASWSQDTITAVTLKPLADNTGTGSTQYKLSFTLTNDIPTGGILRIYFPTSGFTANPTATGLQIMSGTVTGTPEISTTISGASAYFDIKGFTNFGAGATTLYFNMNQGKTSGTVSGTLTSYMSSTATIPIENAALSFTYSSATTIQKTYSFISYVPIYTNTLQNGKGIFSFAFKQSATVGTLSYTGFKIRVAPPTDFPFSETLGIRCKFTNMLTGASYLSHYCYKDSLNNYQIYPPTSNTLAIDEWRVTIFTVGGDLRGLQFPSLNTEHIFTVNVESSTGTVLDTNIIRYKVFNSLTSTGLVDSYVNNINQKNLLKFHVTLASAVATSGRILIELPMINTTTTINSNSLYTGLVFRNLITSKVTLNGATVTADCRLVPGALYDHKPTTLLIDNFGSGLSAGGLVEITVSIVNGPTKQIWTKGQLRTQDSSRNNLDFYTFEYVTYIVDTTATSSTTAFPSPLSSYVVQDLVNFNLNIAPPVALTQANSKLRFNYNSDCYGGSTQGVASHKMELWSTSLAFVSFLSDLGSAAQSIGFTNFKNPVSIAPFTSVFSVDIIDKKVIVATVAFTTSNPTFTVGTFSAISITPDSNLRNIPTNYAIQFTLDKDIPINGRLDVTFPTGYTLVANTCSLGTLKYTTCSIVSSLTVSFTGVQAMTKADIVTIYVTAKNPSMQGTTGTFALNSFDAANYAIATQSPIPGITIANQAAYNFLQNLPIISKLVWAQALDVAPLKFTWDLAAALAMGQTNFVNFVFPANAPEWVLAPTAILQTDLVCRWGNFAASKCERMTNGYRVYTPLENSFASGATVTVHITTNRYTQFGFTYPTKNTYLVAATDNSGNKVEKNFHVPNEAFNSAFIVTRITTLDEYTMLYSVIQPKYAVLPFGAADHSQIIVELATMLDDGTAVFPTELGKGISNGDDVDCVSTQLFKCRISLGGLSTSAPVSIIMEPQTFINSYTSIDIRLAWIRIGSTDKTFTPMRVYLREYDSANSVWIVRQELLRDDIFYTTTFAYDTSEVSKPAPVFNPNNYVGEMSTVAFSFDYKTLVGDLKINTYDRMVIWSQTTNISIQATGVTCAQATVTTHQISQWFEVEPTVLLSPNSGFSITFNNWRNVPYVVAGGVEWTIYLWQDTDLKQVIKYAYTAEAIPHPFGTPLSVTAYNSKVRAVATYEFLFLPFNPIPYGGYIVISVPDSYMAINPQCKIQGLTDATCIVQDGDGDPNTDEPKSIILTGFKDYDPAIDGAVKLTMTLTNPRVGGYTGDFTIETQWTGNQLIDQELQLYDMYIDASATFIELSLTSLQQFQAKTCGGKPGPVKISFSLKSPLTYPNDYLTFVFDNGFRPPASSEELLCYFKFNDIYNLKTHRCDFESLANPLQIRVDATEEKNIPANTVIELTITTRGSDIKYQDGIRVPQTPGQYFVQVYTNINNEEAYPIANIPACPFNNFIGESAVWNADSDTLFNFYATTTAVLPSSAAGGRIVVEIPTHNEIIATYAEDLGWGIPATVNSTSIGCGSACVNCPNWDFTTSTYSFGTPLAPVTPTNVQCTLMKATGQTFGDTATIFSTNMQQIGANTRFNFQVARIRNPANTDWPYWSHVRIRTQAKAADGSYVDINDHWAYFVVPNFLPTASPAAAGGTVVRGNDLVNSINNFTFSHTNAGNVLEYTDYLIYEFNPSDFLLPNEVGCEQWMNWDEHEVVPCAAMRDSLWLSSQINRNYSTFTTVVYENMQQPYYTVDGGIQIYAYEVHQHQVIKKVTYVPYDNVANQIYLAMQTPSNTNDVDLTLKYQIGVFVYTNLAAIKYFRLQMPDDFINPTGCVVRRGLILQDVNNPYNPIQCVITPTTTPPGHLVEVFNFTWGGDGWFILDMVLTNPSTPRYTGRWSLTSYDNYDGVNTNLTRIMDNMNNAAWSETWVGIKPFPNLFRVYRNTKSFEKRRAKDGEYGEIDMRVVTKKDIPAGSGSIQIWLPEEYNIPNGGDAVCTLGNSYHEDLESGSCTITSDRKVYMDTNSATGVPAGTCSLVTATTINSANNNNGFQTPLVPGAYDFQVFMYNGSNLQEYSNPASSVLPQPISTATIKVVHRESSIYSVVRVKFTTPSTIPAGYDTATNILDVFSKPAIGTISVEFNTNDNINGWPGWSVDLGYPSTTDIPCKAISGIKPKTGAKAIKCTIVYAESVNPKYPAKVYVSDFEAIVQDTTLEFHILNVRNPYNYYNNGNLGLRVFETFGDGSTAQIIESVPLYQNPIIYAYVAPQIWDYTALGLTFMTPNTVGSVLVVDFPYDTYSAYAPNPVTGVVLPSVIMNAGDVFKLVLPSPQFKIPDDGSISAAMDGVQLITYVYSDSRVNEIHFEVPAGKTITSTGSTGAPDVKYLSVSQLRNMAYADTVNYAIQIWVIRNTRMVDKIIYDNMPPATPSAPNSLGLVLSSYFSGDVFVTYSFNIVPSYNVPAGSTFTINLPSPQYDNLFSSQPSMICALLSTLLTNCQGTATPGVGTTITFTAASDITESTSLNFQLTGVKNPTFVGTLPTGSVNTVITHTNGKVINQGSFAPITFTTAKSPSKISLTIDVTSYYKSVDSDYTFSLQNSNQLPKGGKIILNFASDWATDVLPAVSTTTISSLKASFTTDTLYYTTTYIPGSSRMEITTQFAWPAKTSIYVKINDLENPSAIDTTMVFRASTIYDSVTLDQTDPLDTSTTITFEVPPPLITVTNSDFYPKNEGELATYDFTLQPQTNDLKAGSQLQLIFPASYGPLLTTVDATITCSSSTFPSITCTVQDGKLIVTIPADVPAGTDFNLVISGITNPSADSTGAITLLTTDGKSTQHFNSKAIPIATSPAPKAFDLTKLTTSSTNLQALSTYTFCAATDQAIPVNAQVFINFPQQFTLRQPSYVCGVTTDNNALIYPSGVTCAVQSNIRRFIMTGQSNSLPGGTLKSLCYEIQGVENPADSGETNSFSMEVYDPATSLVLYRSYGTLSYPTTLTYKRVGLRIIVGSISDFAKGLMSDYITVQLERSVPYQVKLVPKTPGFTFDPPAIYFRTDLAAIQKFRIIPDEPTEAGSYFIQWEKTEDSTSTRFAEVPDSYFNYIATAAFNKYRVILGTTVSRTALRGTSLPISIRLTQSPAKNLTVYYATSKPSQSEYVQFTPEVLVFQPGELEKTFQYKTIDGAVSGLIQFTLQTEFQGIYYMEQNILNFEILDIDTEVPQPLNEYIVTMDRTYMYYRISTSESVWVYYLLTLKGTLDPPIDEIMDPSLRVERGTKTDVMELTGKNSSYQADITSTYIYYDIYLKFTGLEEQTDYVLYYVVEDLSGNALRTRKIEFTTLKKHHPAMFNIMLSDNANLDTLEASFSLITGMQTDRWTIISAPPKFSIPTNIYGTDGYDPLVQALLDADSVTYTIMLLQNMTADEKRPIDIVSLLETNKYLLKEEVPQIIEGYNINQFSYELLEFDNELTYSPLLVEVDEDYATFNFSLKRNGTLYGVLLTKGSARPSARQIKYGLNSTNFLVPTENYFSTKFEYSPTLPYGVYLSKMASFTNLFDNTEYEAHFIGENNLPINPDLMEDHTIVTVPFLTQRELFIIPGDYQFSNIISLPKVLITVLAALLFLF